MTETESRDLQRHGADALLANPKGPDDVARGHLILGILDEHRHDWEGAVAHYHRVLATSSEDPELRYFGNNNLGFSLIQRGLFDEAEPYCLAAIEVEPGRHNAYKNLGLVFIGQGRSIDGALCLLEALRRNPADPRAGHHLEQLLRAKPWLLEQSEELRAGLAEMIQGAQTGEVARMH